MKRRRESIELFGVSFLDVLSCALGGVLLLLLLSSRQRADEAQHQAKRITDLEGIVAEGAAKLGGALAQAQDDERQLEGLQKELDKAQRDNDILEHVNKSLGELHQRGLARIEDLQKVEASLVGLKGKLSNVVFVFDTSGSMKNRKDPRTGDPLFPEYKAFLTNWISSLKFKQFNVVRFSTEPELWQPALRVADPANRQAAVTWVSSFESDGGTNTLAAFQTAMQFPGVDTIIFFSDGAPDNDATDEVLAWLDSNNPRDPASGQRRTTINTIGLGNYFAEKWGDFMNNIADQHDGVFIGR